MKLWVTLMSVPPDLMSSMSRVDIFPHSYWPQYHPRYYLSILNPEAVFLKRYLEFYIPKRIFENPSWLSKEWHCHRQLAVCWNHVRTRVSYPCSIRVYAMSVMSLSLIYFWQCHRLSPGPTRDNWGIQRQFEIFLNRIETCQTQSGLPWRGWMLQNCLLSNLLSWHNTSRHRFPGNAAPVSPGLIPHMSQHWLLFWDKLCYTSHPSWTVLHITNSLD